MFGIIKQIWTGLIRAIVQNICPREICIDNIPVHANWSVISIGDYLGDLSLISHQSTLNSQLQGIQAEAQLEFAMHSKELLKVTAY